jgi:hypothetical protein
MTGPAAAGVDLYWLPLGAGGWFVRLNGRAFEAVAARLAGRQARDLYHSALEVTVPSGRWVIEMGPATEMNGTSRGVVAEGPVGSRYTALLRVLRYEVRCWRGGTIPGVAEAVDSPQRLTDDPVVAQRILDLVPAIPTPVWGRDDLGAGDMWNSNSFVSWLIVRGGIDPGAARIPAGGRAPGWDAGLTVASRAAPPARTAPEGPDG